MNVLGWTRDNTGCGWYRIREPLRVASQHGHNVAVSNKLNGIEAFNYNVIIGQFIAGEKASQYWQDLCSLPIGKGPTMVFELDDDPWNLDKSVYIHKDPQSEERYNQKRLKYFEDNISAAHIVTTTTENLAEKLRKFNSNVHVVPNTVPSWILNLGPARIDERFTIGYPTSTSHLMDVQEHTDALMKYLVNNPDSILHFIGPPEITTDIGGYEVSAIGDRIKSTPWQTDIPTYYRSCIYDMVIAPLKKHKFNDAKSGIKAIEAAALGLPVVVSDELPYRDIVEHGVTGFKVNHFYEWGEYIGQLHRDEKLRLKMGQEAHKRAQKWTTEHNIERWLTAWQSR